jgi:hypothetical protein
MRFRWGSSHLRPRRSRAYQEPLGRSDTLTRPPPPMMRSWLLGLSGVEIAEIKQVVREKQTAPGDRQKTLRAKLRKLGFYISDYSDEPGFVESDVGLQGPTLVIRVSLPAGDRAHGRRCARRSRGAPRPLGVTPPLPCIASRARRPSQRTRALLRGAARPEPFHQGLLGSAKLRRSARSAPGRSAGSAARR